VITSGAKLSARHVIHAVGPRWRGGGHGEAALLAGCYRTSLQLASQYGLRSIAFPAISCGIYGYPIRPATEIAVRETLAFLQGDATIERVLFVCFGEDIAAAYAQVLGSLA